MALPYPEGEVYFKRSLLKYRRSRQSGKVYDVPYHYKRGLGNRAYESLCFDIQVSIPPRLPG